VAKLTELKAEQTKQQQLIESLQAAVREFDKLTQLATEDQELAATRALMTKRLASTTEAKPAIDQDVQEQQETVEKANYRVDDQRSRILSLANRRLALGESVVEARGVQRGVRTQMQAIVDAQADCEQQKARIEILRGWLELRSELQQVKADGDASSKAAIQAKLDLQQANLIESWRRSFAFRQVRGLNPEQMAGATYTALEMYRPIRAKALSDWETTHQNNPAEREDVHAYDQRRLRARPLSQSLVDRASGLRHSARCCHR
jgi:predicted RNase H-like nuclease (RuvC/YqgF family)